MEDIACKNVISTGNTGDIPLKNVTAAEILSIERSSGDVKLDGCDAVEICMKTGAGDVEGRILTDKVFFTQTDTGDIDVPQMAEGGKCEIRTTTGDIKITID